MLILGLSGSPNLLHEQKYQIHQGNFHDAAAVLVADGKIVAAFEEERLNKIKHTNKFPFMAAKACLTSYGASLKDIDYFSFSQSENSLNAILATQGRGQASSGTPARRFLRSLLETGFGAPVDMSKFDLFDHHYAHAASAYYPSGFSRSLVLTIDGSGGEYAGSVCIGEQDSLKTLQTFSVEQSLGHLYNRVTMTLGFGYFDEYKVMGLAPYGNPRLYKKLFDKFYTLLPEGNYVLHNHELERLKTICPSGLSPALPTQQQMDIAASLQEMLENIVFHIVTHYRQQTGLTHLCMAGGVALNCTLNGKLLNAGIFADMFVCPAANDSGLPAGSALAAYFKHAVHPQRYLLDTLFLGSDIGDDDHIAARLADWAGWIQVEKIKNIEQRAAALLAADKVIGWVQGRAEFAPRALGNRSILADSRPAANKERINAIVKKREAFRPFAPSVLEEHARDYFEMPAGKDAFPHMIYILQVKRAYRQLLGAITHVDGTARVQTVSRDDNPRYWSLIEHFRQLTGTPVLLNTSFNNNVEPIVDSVKDAVTSFLTTQLDYLIVGDYLVSREPMQQAIVDAAYISLPPYIRLKRETIFSSVNDLAEEDSYFIETTYNDKKIPVCRQIFDILRKARGNTRLDELVLNTGQDEKLPDSSLTDQLLSLWSQRIVIISPIPVYS